MLRLAVRVSKPEAELVLAELLGLAPSGVEEVDRGDEIEYAVYGAPGELPALPDLKAAAGDALVSVSTSEVSDDWADRWREFHKALVLKDRLRVRPPWEAKGAEPYDLVIDPGRAFGTGAHPTTRLCLELMLAEPPVGSLLDLGCGSGVIAILGAKLGFDPVMALDNDPLAVDATLANAAANEVTLTSALFDLRRGELPPCDLLVANILAGVLEVLAGRLGDHPPRRVILSGLLEDELASMSARWTSSGYVERSRAVGDGWGALLLEAGGVDAVCVQESA